MRDEEYKPDEVPAYGESAQPAIAARMRPHLRMTQIGTVIAVVALVFSVVGLISFPVSFTGGAGFGWAVCSVVCAAALAAICAFQLVNWSRAMRVWAGAETSGAEAAEGQQAPLQQPATHPAGLGRVRQLSFAAHIASYLVVLVALWACIAGSSYAGWTATSAAMQALALAAMLAAQTLAGVQYLRPAGPPGTIPAHMRRIVARENDKARRLTPPAG